MELYRLSDKTQGNGMGNEAKVTNSSDADVAAACVSEIAESQTQSDLCIADETLWCVHVIGPDDLIPAPDHDTAVMWARRIDHMLKRMADPHKDDPFWPQSHAEVAEWPHDAASHAEGVSSEYAWVMDYCPDIECPPAHDDHLAIAAHDAFWARVRQTIPSLSWDEREPIFKAAWRDAANAVLGAHEREPIPSGSNDQEPGEPGLKRVAEREKFHRGTPKIIDDLAVVLADHTDTTQYEAMLQGPDIIAALRAAGWQIVPALADGEWQQ